MIGFNHLGRLGRLGNQMFQYAALKGIAAHKGYQWCIPNYTQEVDDGIGNMLKTELFDCFVMKNVSKEKNISLLGGGNAPILQERFFHFDQEFFNGCPDNTSIWGFFQSEKWFKHIESEIREDFSFPDSIKEPCKEMISSVDSPIALHIRRTDYLINSQHHNNLGLDYYKKAISKFDDDRNIIVFSDDPNWCKEQDIFSNDRFLISENTDNRIDLCLMSMCSDFIIANSTFSWWGAWLADCGRVIAPTQWFGPANQHKDLKDLYPKHWELI